MSALEVGGKFNFIGQKERLIYLGYKDYRQFGGYARWYQFALVDEPAVVWSELNLKDLGLIEASK